MTYKEKYLALLTVYNLLHAELHKLKVALDRRIKDHLIAKSVKNDLYETNSNFIKNIEKIDGKARKVISSPAGGENE